MLCDDHPVRRPRALTAILSVCLVLLVSGGCGVRIGRADDEPSAGATVTVTSSPESPSSSPTPSQDESRAPTSAPPTPTAPTRTRAALPPPLDLSGYDLPGFTSPSGNLGCLFDSYQRPRVRCDRREWEGSVPPPPPDCEFDWGHSVEMSAGRRAALACVSDSVMGLQGETDGSRVLPYGDAVRYRGITCRSTEAGVRCRTSGGHGFLVARAVVSVR